MNKLTEESINPVISTAVKALDTEIYIQAGRYSGRHRRDKSVVFAVE